MPGLRMDQLIGFVGSYLLAVAAAVVCLVASLLAASLLALVWGDAPLEISEAASWLVALSIPALIVVAPLGAFALTGPTGSADIAGDLVNALRAAVGGASFVGLFFALHTRAHSYGFQRRPTMVTALVVVLLGVVAPFGVGIPVAVLIADWLPVEVVLVYVAVMLGIGIAWELRERAWSARFHADRRGHVPVDRLLDRWRDRWISIAAQEDPAFGDQLNARGWQVDGPRDAMMRAFWDAVRAMEPVGMTETARRRLDLVDYSEAGVILAAIDLGGTYCERQVRRFTDAIAVDPRDPTPWSIRATLRGWSGDAGGADADFDRALELTSDRELADLIGECRVEAARAGQQRRQR